MKQKTLYAIWGVLYALCCALGFLPQKGALLTVFSVLFFLPGVLILADAYKQQNQTALRTLRYVSLGSLVLTLALLAASFASAQGSLKLGDVLHYILGIVSVPMFCSSIWALSLFLWACLFIASFPKVIGK
jgi:hypothetical protein